MNVYQHQMLNQIKPPRVFPFAMLLVLLMRLVSIVWSSHYLLHYSVLLRYSVLSQDLVIRNLTQKYVSMTQLLLENETLKNQSTAHFPIQEDIDVFLSNSSLSNITNNSNSSYNKSLKLSRAPRSGQRQLRLKALELDILHRLGLSSGKNITFGLSDEERISRVRAYIRTELRRPAKRTRNPLLKMAERFPPSLLTPEESSIQEDIDT